MAQQGMSAVPIFMMLPIGLFGFTPPPAAPTITPVLVQAESITERRADADTFRRRWPAELPPAVVIREVPVPAAVEAAATIPLPPARIVKRVALRRDICAVHGMRRVTYTVRGYQHWRCQR